jgi:hypothetical protein
MASAPSAVQRGGATAPDKVLCVRLAPASDAEKLPNPGKFFIVLFLPLPSYVGSSGKKVAQQEKTRISNPL